MKRRALFALCALAAAVSGCRTLPVAAPATAQSWEARRAALQGREHFQIKGRVAVAAGQDGFTAALRWAQSGLESQLSLDGPLGVGGVHVTSAGTTLTLLNSRGERLDSDAARAELAKRLGFDAPLASLRYWILGVPDPSSAPAAEIVDVEQRLTNLEQNGWQIEYADYMVMNGEWLPGRMTLHRADVRVRLIVDHWDS
jgi:outer membrane lipoprotein LolB